MNVNLTSARSIRVRRTLLGAIATLGFAASAAAASDGRNPASLLLYPEFDNRAGVVTIISITNVDTRADATDVDVEFIYIGRFGDDGQPLNCGEFNRTETLTPGDTLTAITKAHNPEHEQGYVYAFAKNALNEPIVYNWLTGNLMTVDGLSTFEYSMNPVAYRGIGNGEGTVADLDDDGHLDMNGCEYGPNPDRILIPRFLGQGGPFQSDLILIGLSGGTAFTTTVDFLIFNDNEEIFSSEHSFLCWERTPLLAISGIFDTTFLKMWTDHDPDEVLGAPTLESGWIHIQGAVANSANTSIPNPSVYAVLVERTGNRGAADLPFEDGARTNGELLPTSVDGDTVDVTCP